MAHPWHHSISSAKKYGGQPADYLPLHNWFDHSKQLMGDLRHRALRHHAEGIFLAEQIFGVVIVNSDGRAVPTRFLGEQHVKEDLGWIPSMQDWFRHIVPTPWMRRGGKLEFPGEEQPDGVDVGGSGRLVEQPAAVADSVLEPEPPA